MNQEQLIKLIKLPKYFVKNYSKIALESGYVDLEADPFIAVGLKRSKVAEDWEDTDYIEIIILARAIDGNYYHSAIEHPADILAPKYADDDMRICWVEEHTESKDNLLIDNLYSLNDSRCRYTLTIYDKPYLFIEKYIVYKLSASYEVWELHDKTQEISSYFIVRCKFSAHHPSSRLEDTPTETLEYPIAINSLLRTSVFQPHPFKIWNGEVIVDNLIVSIFVS